jgi:hypothetical protein
VTVVGSRPLLAVKIVTIRRSAGLFAANWMPLAAKSMADAVNDAANAACGTADAANDVADAANDASYAACAIHIAASWRLNTARYTPERNAGHLCIIPLL